MANKKRTKTSSNKISKNKIGEVKTTMSINLSGPYMPEAYVGQDKKVFEIPSKKDEIYSAMSTGRILQGTVNMVEDGKFYLQYGDVRCIIPKEEYDTYDFKNLHSQIWRTINFVVLGFDEKANLAACSRKRALEIMAVPTFESLKPGQIRTGVVKGMSDRAAYLDLGGGVTAILPCAQMHYSKPAHPSELLNTDDLIDVLVLAVNPKKEVVIVGLKQLLNNPWDHFLEKYRVDSVVGGIVRGIHEQHGVFVELESGIVGLAPQPRVKVNLSDKVMVQIKKIDTENKRSKFYIIGKSNWGGNYGGGISVR